MSRMPTYPANLLATVEHAERSESSVSDPIEAPCFPPIQEPDTSTTSAPVSVLARHIEAVTADDNFPCQTEVGPPSADHTRRPVDEFYGIEDDAPELRGRISEEYVQPQPTSQAIETANFVHRGAEDVVPLDDTVNLSRGVSPIPRSAYAVFGCLDAATVDTSELQQPFDRADCLTPPSGSMSKNNYGAIELHAKGNSRIVFGDVYYRENDQTSLFGTLKIVNLDADDIARSSYRSSRQDFGPQTLLNTMPNDRYTPYAKVESRNIKQSLYRIAEILQFLDTAFAEYFRIVVPFSQSLSNQLDSIEEAIFSRQREGRKYIGALGKFCNTVMAKKKKITGQIPPEKFKVIDFGPHALAYLQDGLEAPYWFLIADIFIQSCRDGANNETTIKVVLRVINDSRRELRLRMQKLKQSYPTELPKEIEDGINMRMTVLDKLIDESSGNFNTEEDLQVQALQQSATTLEQPVGASQEPMTISQIYKEGATDLEKVSQSSLFVLFLAAALIPAMIGFAKYYDMQPGQNAIGSFADPDLMWMLSGFLLAVLGNIFSIVPLFRLTRGSVGYKVTWFFIYLSIVFGIISLATYTTLNKAYTSAFSFLSNFFAIGAVFASTQQISSSSTASNSTVSGSKIKRE